MFKKADIVRLLQKVKGSVSKDDGLSLIEAAIGLIILGLIALPLIQAYRVDLVKETNQITRGALANVTEGINQFHGSGNGAYPCPSSLTLREGDTGYGMSGDCTLANVRLCTDPVWPANEGICKTDNTVDAIIIGGVPFATLKMHQEESLDFWGNKIIYTVTHKQTDPVTYVTNAGQIQLMTADNPVNVLAGSEDGVPDLTAELYDMFLFSTGANGVGGYSKEGVAILPCGTPLTGYENENCDFDDIFFADVNPTDNTASIRSEVVGTDFFDDMTRAQEFPPASTWFPHQDNPTYVNNDFVLTLSTRIGVGTTTPDESLEVIGAIRAQPAGGGIGGRLMSDGMCNDTDCFDPEQITGVDVNMNCNASGTYAVPRTVTEISANTVKCTTNLDTGGNPIGNGNVLQVDSGTFGSVDCGATGRIAGGIDASGDLICVIP